MSRTTGATANNNILSASKVHQCDVCGKNFPFKVVLDMHKKDHVFKNHYKCHLCPSAYPKKSQLEMHHRTHTGERPFKCDECSAAFMNSSNLHRHKRKHACKRKYDCNEWEAALALTNTLGDEKQIKKCEPLQTFEKYTCDTCGQTFDKSNLLVIHKKKHDKPFICDVCGLSFQTRVSFDYHRLRHVNEELTSWPNSVNICSQSFNSRALYQHEPKLVDKFSIDNSFERDQNTLSDSTVFSANYSHHSDLSNPFQQTVEELNLQDTPNAVQPSIILNEQPQSLHDNQLQELHSPSHFYIGQSPLAHLVQDHFNQFSHSHFISGNEQLLHLPSDPNINHLSMLSSPLNYPEETVVRHHSLVSEAIPSSAQSETQNLIDNSLKSRYSEGNQNITSSVFQNINISNGFNEDRDDVPYQDSSEGTIKSEECSQVSQNIKEEPND